MRDAVAAASRRSAGGRTAASTRRCAGCSGCPSAVTAIIQNGRLDIYLTVTFTVVALTLLLPMVVFERTAVDAGSADAAAA